RRGAFHAARRRWKPAHRALTARPPSTDHSPMPRVALPLLAAAFCVAFCGASCARGPAGPSPASTGEAAATASAPASALAPPPSPSPARPPLSTREGSTIARSPTDDVLYVADEDHGVVRRIPLPLAAVASPPADIS